MSVSKMFGCIIIPSRVCVAFITLDAILNIMGVSGIESPGPDSQLQPSQFVSGSDSGVT